MVGFIPQPTIVKEEDHNQTSKSNNFKDPLEDFTLADLSFADSFLDFDSIKDFLEDTSGFDKSMEMDDKISCTETQPIVNGSNPIEGGSGCAVMVEGNLRSCIEEEMGKVSLVGGLSPVCGDGIAVKSEIVGDVIDMRKVSLVAGSSSVDLDGSVAKSGVASDEMNIGNVNLATGSSSVTGVGSHVNNVVTSDEDESESESESATESSSSSTSSSDDSSSGSSSSDDDDGEKEEDEEEEEEAENEKEEVKLQLKREAEEGEIEEGEIRDGNGEEMVGKTDEFEDNGDKMIDWSDAEFDDMEEEDTFIAKGPIRSKNELKVLPPVPPVDVTLQPHHQMLSVGTVLSIISAQVIVEGLEKHNPLNEGSILWITEKRSPLGLVDETFGPVQNPYYVVRYNSESEVPAGIHQGTLISFVPEFANHVLSDKNLYKKGYDASGENDEELSDDVEFSDDEREAEYRRMQKMTKRGMNHQTIGNKKNNRRFKNRNGNWKNDASTGQQTLMGVGQPPPNQNQHNTSSIGALMNNCPSSTIGQDFHGGTGYFPSFSPMAPTAGVFQPSNGVWVKGLPSQQPHNAAVPGGFPANNISWPPQNQLLQPSQMPFQQQFNPSQMSLPYGILTGGQMNLCAGPSPWPAVIGQNCFNQAAIMGFRVQPVPPTMNTINMGDQGMMSNGLRMEQNANLAPRAVIPENIQAPQQFNLGAPSSGRKPYHHGRGGRFAGGRGRQQPSK